MMRLAILLATAATVDANPRFTTANGSVDITVGRGESIRISRPGEGTDLFDLAARSEVAAVVRTELAAASTAQSAALATAQQATETVTVALSSQQSTMLDMIGTMSTASSAAIVAQQQTIDRQAATLTEFVTCADQGKILSDGVCVSPEPSLTRTDQSCNWNTHGQTRWVNETASFQICAKTLSNLSVWRNPRFAPIPPDAANPAESCLSILEENPMARSGLYWLRKHPQERGSGGDLAMEVYCLMADLDRAEGGGWALGTSNNFRAGGNDVYLETHTERTGRNFEWMRRRDWRSYPRGHPTKQVVYAVGGANQSTQVARGTSHHLPSIVRLARQKMYTGGDLAPFLAATFIDGGQSYWNYLNGRRGTNSGRVRVRYFTSGTANWWTRNGLMQIEVCSAYPWGHRADVTRVTSPCGGAHVCWEDVANCCKDRPFAGDHCPSSTSGSWCPVYGRDRQWFLGRGGNRNGNMAMLTWYRW